jgi:hypothetical protein
VGGCGGCGCHCHIVMVPCEIVQHCVVVVVATWIAPSACCRPSLLLSSVLPVGIMLLLHYCQYHSMSVGTCLAGASVPGGEGEESVWRQG